MDRNIQQLIQCEKPKSNRVYCLDSKSVDCGQCICVQASLGEFILQYGGALAMISEAFSTSSSGTTNRMKKDVLK